MVVLQNRSAYHKIVVSGHKEAPFPAASFPDPMEVSLNWLLQQVRFQSDSPSDEGNGNAVLSNFRIDLSPPSSNNSSNSNSCRTPRLNDDVRDALEFLSRLHEWAGRVHGYFCGRAAALQQNPSKPYSSSSSSQQQQQQHSSMSPLCPFWTALVTAHAHARPPRHNLLIVLLVTLRRRNETDHVASAAEVRPAP